MGESNIFYWIFGSIFLACGVIAGLVGVCTFLSTGDLAALGAVSIFFFVFGAFGGGMILYQIKAIKRRKRIQKEGKHFTGKIYGYVEDRSCMINGAYPFNTKVRYFDEYNTERETILPTGFFKGSGDFPIGATIDIIVLGSDSTWVKGSVRYEYIDKEDELMDNKPLDPALKEVTAVTCNHCAATFTATRGYVSTCPYCGNKVNC